MQGDQGVSWAEVIDDYQVWMRAAALAEGTIKLKRYQLLRVAEVFPDGPWSVTADGVVSWIAAQRWGKASVASYRGMLSSFYRWAVITGRIPESPVAVLPAPPKPSLRPRPAPDRITKESLLSASPRTGLMIRLARRGGLRRGEIARAHSDDLIGETVAEDGEVLTEWWLTIYGKGGKWRSVLLDQETVDHWHHWLDGRTGWVFPGAISGHLAPETVGRLVNRHLLGPWTAHTLRHRFGTSAYEGSHDLRAVQELLGHAKPETTMIYTDVGKDAKRAAARFAHQRLAS